LEVESSEERARAAMATEQGYDSGVWKQLSDELAWTALTIPEVYGGLGMSYLDLHPLMEEMGRALLCSPFFSTICLGANALLLGGTEAQKERVLPTIATGEATATLAYAGRNRWHEADAIAATCVRTEGGFTIRGSAHYVVDGHTADWIVVAARGENSEGFEGVSLFLIPSGTKGLTRTWTPTVDQTRRLAQLDLEGVRVPASAALGEPEAAGPALAHVLDLAAVALAAEQVGGAQRCLDMAVAYAKERVQFGRPIGSFQAIKHKCADMLLEVESAKSAAYYGLWCAAEMNDELPSVASLAKSYCSEAYFHAAAENIQIHGGIGFTWEHPAHLYFKRAKSSELMFGDPAYHRELLAQRIGL